MKYSVIVRPEAEDDLKEAFSWYEDKRVGLGHDFLLQVNAGLNFIIRAGTADRVIYPSDLGLEATGPKEDKKGFATLKEAREAAEKASIRRAMAMTGNNISQAAKLLEVSRPTLHDLLKKHGIDT